MTVRAHCGTNSGYVLHGRAGEPACEDCKRGKREYQQALKVRRLRESYGAPEPRSVAVSEPEGYPEGWSLPKGSKVRRFGDGEPVLVHDSTRSLHMTLDGREFTTDLDSEDLAPRATADHLDAQWKARVRREVYGG